MSIFVDPFGRWTQLPAESPLMYFRSALFASPGTDIRRRGSEETIAGVGGYVPEYPPPDLPAYSDASTASARVATSAV